MEKILWVVNYDDVKKFASAANKVGATGVAIRTDNNLRRAIEVFHPIGIKVFGWRWPSAKRDAAMHEAEKAAAAFAYGMDGYFVDPEGEPGTTYDWNQHGLDTLAREFCTTVSSASEGRIFGVTSHYRAKDIFPHLPWREFFLHANVLIPQAYWRVAQGTVCHGDPTENYDKSLDFWATAGGMRSRIAPMAGEIALAKSSEILEYVEAAKAHNAHALHFYTYNEHVPPSVWNSIRSV
jgi:hypothetical protein